MGENIIVVPCFNEEKRLRSEEFEDFVSKNDSFKLLFVNDGSTDNTKNLLDGLRKKFENKILLLNIDTNVGKAEAIRLAISHAADLGFDFDFIGFLDADLSTPLSEAKRLFSIASSEKKLMVFGSRVKLLSNDISRSAKRHYMGRIFATFASITLKLAVYDTQCGAKVFHRSVIETLFKKPFLSRWIFDVELFMRYRNSYDLSMIKEVILEKWTAYDGSKIRLIDIFRVPMELLKIAMNDRKSKQV